MRFLKQFIGVLTVVFAINACSTSPEQSINYEAKAEALRERFVAEFLVAMPDWALWAGNYSRADQLTVPNEASVQALRQFVERWRIELASIERAALTNSTRLDLDIIENRLDQIIFDLDELKSGIWNPAAYNVAGGFSMILANDNMSVDERLRIISARLVNVPAYYQTATENLTGASAKHAELAIAQNQGGLGVFTHQIPDMLAESQLPDAEVKILNERLGEAVVALEHYVSFLESQLDSWRESGRDFRLGGELYDRKFTLAINVGLTARELYNKAIEDKAQVELAMIELAVPLWSKYFPDQVRPVDDREMVAALLSRLSQNHTTPEAFVNDVRAQIPELSDFVNERDLITQDPTKPLVVRETPEWMRGVAGASISAPGPFDKSANTYYNVDPLDQLPPETAASMLREYNEWMLQILNIHEAIPGHYTQLVYSNKTPSLVKSMFGNGAMIEGWAVYAERMMLEEGYGDFEPELWLMYYKWNLRVIANTILDYSVHNLGMTREEGLALLMSDAFQERAEAEAKWRRVELSSVQLTSYYAGYRAIYDFRTQYRAVAGSDYSIKDFNEAFLSFGSAPIPDIVDLMMKQISN